MRNGLEGHHDLGHAIGQALAGAEVEGHPAPAPVGDLRLDGHEGFSARGTGAQLLQIALHRPAAGGTRAVLPAHGEVRHTVARHRLQRLQHLQLLVAQRVCRGGGWRLHGNETEQLQHVVLHHVTQRARRVVVSGTALHTQRFGHRDLHMVDMGGVPHGLEQGIGEAQRHQVLHRLFAEIVIDAVNLRLADNLPDRVIQRLGRSAGLTQRLLDHHAGARRHQVVAPQLVTQRAEQVRPHGEVEHPHTVRLGLQGLGKVGPAGVLRGIRRHIAQARKEARHHFGRALGFRHMVLDGLLCEGDEIIIGQRAARAADDARAGRDLPLQVAVEQRGQKLALRKVARGAEDHQVKQLHRDDARGHECLSASFDVRHSDSGFRLRVNEGGNTSRQVIYCNFS